MNRRSPSIKHQFTARACRRLGTKLISLVKFRRSLGVFPQPLLSKTLDCQKPYCRVSVVQMGWDYTQFLHNLEILSALPKQCLGLEYLELPGPSVIVAAQTLVLLSCFFLTSDEVTTKKSRPSMIIGDLWVLTVTREKRAHKNKRQQLELPPSVRRTKELSLR